MKILLVEDDSALRSALEELLNREGYDVVKTSSIRSAKAEMNSDIDLIMLDVGLPDGDGVSLCRQWRSEGMQIPILFLTAKDEELDVVRGLDAGGNDYVTKPFRMQELLSRIRALLRRNQKETTITRSGITLDKAKLQASREGEALQLTVTEYKILAKLISERSIITRAALLEALWDVDSRFIDDNTLSVHVSRLREKVGGSHIKTIRGVGYQWVD
ncbi:MAG: response regulator transcription factor [Oscillospiraceae bacterium]|nr:response regulator transcription factor [Oscillospiraceae bacterium]